MRRAIGQPLVVMVVGEQVGGSTMQHQGGRKKIGWKTKEEKGRNFESQKNKVKGMRKNLVIIIKKQ